MIKASTHTGYIYFLGIGGIGMSALAFYYLENGYDVLGYDQTQTDLCLALEKKGAKIEYDYNLEIARTLSKDKSLVIYTPAIKEEQPIFSYFLKHNFQCIKRAKALGLISKNKTTIAVAGTHGKTTITCMLGHILRENNEAVTMFAGGIAENYNTNYFSNGNDLYVVEADEYDRSFLNLNPEYAVISNIDADHLDIYNSKQNLELSFKEFASLINNKSNLYHNQNIRLGGKTIGLHSRADIYAKNISIDNGVYIFDYVNGKHTIKDVRLKMPGEHNLFNALCALSLAITLNTYKSRSFADSLSTFKGVKRRFNYLVENKEIVIIDDYAHHPTEIKAVLHAIRQMHQHKRAVCVFQPHLFSRTKDFMKEFSEVLSEFDGVRLLEIYPAREEPLKDITSEKLLDRISIRDKKIITKEELVPEISEIKDGIIALLGAGDIGIEAQKVKNYFKHEKKT